MESRYVHKRIYINDLNGNIFPVDFDSNGNITNEEVWRILVRSMYGFTNQQCTRMLIALVKSLISKFYTEDYSPFIVENISEETKCYRFSNDANLSLSFIPIKNEGEYILLISAGIEME